MDRAQDLQARKRNSAVSSARDASGYEIKKKISERKWLLRRIGSSLLPSPLQFYISYIHGLGKALNLRDVSMVAVRDFTKFRFLPPLSTDWKTIVRIFPSAGSENPVYPHFIPLFFLLSCYPFFLWRIYFDFSFSISFPPLPFFFSSFFVFLSIGILPASFPGEGKFKLQGVIRKQQNWWWVFCPKFYFFYCCCL